MRPVQSFLGITLLLTITQLHAQKKDISFETIPSEHGLSNHSIHAIIQDSRGFIWVGTQDGLNQYNGYDFTVYFNSPGDSSTLSHNNIYEIVEDSEGYLWIATVNGLNRFDPETSEFKRYYHDPDDPESICHNDIRVLIEDREGYIWLGTWGGGVSRFDKETGKCIHYKHEPGNPNSLSHNQLWGMFEDSDGEIWFSTWGGGLNRFNPETEEFTIYRPVEGDPRSISHDIIGTMAEDTEGNLWITTWGGGLNKFNKETGKFTRYMHDPEDPRSISSNLVWPVEVDENGWLYLGCYGSGIDHFDVENNIFYHYTPDPKDPFSVASKDNWSLEFDQSGILWIGSDGKGLSNYTGISKKFSFLTEDTTKETSLSYNAIKAINQDKDGKLWIGTWHAGIDRMDPKTERIINYRRDIQDASNTGRNRISELYFDSKKQLWMGALRGGLTLFDWQSGKLLKDFMHDPDDPESLSANAVESIVENPDGKLWIGTRHGLNLFDPESGTFKHYFYKRDDPNSLSNNYINIVFRSDDQTIWIGTNNGLNRYDPGQDQFIHYKHQPGQENTLIHNTINTIHQDQAGYLWLGTRGGLCRFDPDSNVYRSYTTENGLASNIIFGILEDDQHNLWLSTNSGITKYIRDNEEFVNYDKKDGLKASMFFPNACHKAADGKMYFGSWEGLTSFYPEEIEINQYKPPVLVVTDFSQRGKRKTVTSFSEATQSYEFKYFNNSFIFRFVALNFINSEKNQYAYMMENFDEDWQYVGTTRFANYTNLDPGKYTFKVKAANNDGLWNETPSEINILIKPPFWQKAWFIALCVIVAGLIIYAYIKYRERQLVREKKILEEKVRQRTREIARQKEHIETMHNELTDSIMYAERIQKAVLPSEEFMKRNLGAYFIMFHPQSIVSGDFYFVTKVRKWLVLVAADCTGHGVPGAFMSMLGISFLQEILNREEITKANEVLNELREYVITSLKQKGISGEQKDGMDIALIALDTQNNICQFAGANNPLWIIRNHSGDEADGTDSKKEQKEMIQLHPGNESLKTLSHDGRVLYAISGDRMPVAIHANMKEFTNNTIKLQKGDQLYMFSDGYADQFGGPLGKKFKYKPLKELLLKHADKKMYEQKEILEHRFEEWKGELEQIDDVVLMGIKID